MRTTRTTVAVLGAAALLCAAALSGCSSGSGSGADSGGVGGGGSGSSGSGPEWGPADQGLLTWNYDPSAAGATWNPTATELESILASMRPIIGDNLNPWPEKPNATWNPSRSGTGPSTGFQSGVVS